MEVSYWTLVTLTARSGMRIFKRLCDPVVFSDRLCTLRLRASADKGDIMAKELLHSRYALIAVALFALASCEQSKAPEPKQAQQPSAAAPAEERVERNPDRNAYFGEEHIHTSWSVDAWVIGNRLTGPAEALKFAQGETIKHPLGYDVKIDTPMDFMGVTDHAEYVGVTKEANTPGTAISKM